MGSHFIVVTGFEVRPVAPPTEVALPTSIGLNVCWPRGLSTLPLITSRGGQLMMLYEPALLPPRAGLYSLRICCAWRPVYSPLPPYLGVDSIVVCGVVPFSEQHTPLVGGLG